MTTSPSAQQRRIRAALAETLAEYGVELSPWQLTRAARRIAAEAPATTPVRVPHQPTPKPTGDPMLIARWLEASCKNGWPTSQTNPAGGEGRG